ncbi:hypothetical protein ZOSMA_153G00080 [Zostera marina]|uniref:Alpha-carbonic anhydrase domain-containing protein n=1 Tax=Zostera marina TaxID=29655 RepID=A0A0K9PVX3_ZOSMR|nr:hypothetical protein ZOSMA_153G00080 [Zostera marina]
MINPNKTIEKCCHGYYRYMGSLTTPPCTEGVIWTVMEQIRPISAKQVKMLKRAVETEFKKNARPIQAIHDRQIKLYQPNNLIHPINQNHYY